MYLPKVLIVNQGFNNDTAGGITLTNLFKGWDRDKLAVACDAHLLFHDMDVTICDNYYQLGCDELYMAFPFKRLSKSYKSGKIQFLEGSSQDLAVKKSKVRAKVIMNYLYPSLKFLGIYNYMHKARLSKSFCEWVKEFDPDIIYVHAERRDRISFCIDLHKFTGKPMIFHMMDDWPSVSNSFILRRFWQRKIDKELKSLFDRTSLFLGISDFMTEEYKARYGKYFIPFHNPIDVESWVQFQKEDYSLSESPVILYAGRIGLGVERSLLTIAKAVQQVNNELKISTKFMIYTQVNPVWTSHYACVEYKGFIPHDRMPSVLAGADLLILPYDFSKKSLQFVKYSMSTKTTEYMASGTPMIVFAPEETALVQYVRKYECASVISNNNDEELTQVIKKLIQDGRFREKLGRNAIQIAEKFHDGKHVREEFKNAISSLMPQAQS